MLEPSVASLNRPVLWVDHDQMAPDESESPRQMQFASDPIRNSFVSIVLHRTAWHVLSITVVPHELVHVNEDDDVHLSLAVGSDDANGHMIGDPII